MANRKKYNWDKWLSRKRRFFLTRGKGKDYEPLSHSFAQQVRNRAADRGQGVSIQITEKGMWVTNIFGDN